MIKIANKRISLEKVDIFFHMCIFHIDKDDNWKLNYTSM